MKPKRILLPILLALLTAAALRAQGPPRPENLHPADPLKTPRFVPASRAGFLSDSDLVLGAASNGIAKAYYTTGIAYHHFIEDRLGGMPLLVTW